MCCVVRNASKKSVRMALLMHTKWPHRLETVSLYRVVHFRKRVFWQVWLNRKALRYSLKSILLIYYRNHCWFTKFYTHLCEWCCLVRNIYFCFLCLSVCQHVWCICVQHVYAWCLWVPSEGIGCPGRRLPNGLGFHVSDRKKRSPVDSEEVLLIT